MGLHISHDAVLDRIRYADVASAEKVRVLGVDDFAFRKGRSYGTILVVQQRRRIIDLLPDREASSLAAWLKNHPEVEIVTRDRGQVYADGIRQGAPQAVQVADRLHLMQNLTDSLKRLVGVALPFAKPFTSIQTILYVAKIVFIHRHPRSRFNLARLPCKLISVLSTDRLAILAAERPCKHWFLRGDTLSRHFCNANSKNFPERQRNANICVLAVAGLEKGKKCPLALA